MDAPPQTVHWGALEQTAANRARCRAFASTFTTIPRSEWRTCRRRHLVRHIYDQLDGHCMSNAAAGMVMAVREAAGLPCKILVPPTLYEQHSRWGAGSSIGENVEALITTGICDADFAGGDQVRLAGVPSNWRDNARRYRILRDEAYDLDGDLDAVATAILLGFCPIIGVTWPGGGGHGVLATDLVVEGSAVSLEGPNSWGAKWNGIGFWSLTERQLGSMARYGAYACRAVVEG
jgi:hypothetical protein